ncbi:MAG: hypothetical protein ACLQJ0_17595, partial [Steroidobacteraceae bacterium]
MGPGYGSSSGSAAANAHISKEKFISGFVPEVRESPASRFLIRGYEINAFIRFTVIDRDPGIAFWPI